MSADESEIYTRLLLPKGYGCPIWCPEPDEHLSPEYREHGVRIGDVGRIIPGGGFDPLFNICVAAEDPINRDGVPNGFEPQILNRNDVIFRSRYHRCGSHVCSKPLKKTRLESDIGSASRTSATRSTAGYRFTCSSTMEGAILLMPDGASRQDLRNRKAQFHQYAIQNALHWYRFSNEWLGRQIPNGSLILVTGCDMASSWGIASFSDVPEDMQVELSLIPSFSQTSISPHPYQWQTNVSASARTHPADESILTSDQVDNDMQSSSWNQPGPEDVRDLQSIMALQNRYPIDASYGTFNDVGGYQVNITNNIMLPNVGDVSPASVDFSQEIRTSESREALDQPVDAITGEMSETVQASPALSESIPHQNQCVFLRGFRISVRTGIFSTMFRGPLDVSFVNDATTEDIFGSKNSFFPFSPWLGGISSWSGGGSTSSTPSKSSQRRAFSLPNTKEDRYRDTSSEVTLEPLLTTPEPYHPSDIINRWLFDNCPEAIVALTHDDDWIALMREDDITIPEEPELLRRLTDKYTLVTNTISRENLPYLLKGNNVDDLLAAYLQEKSFHDLDCEGEIGGEAGHQITKAGAAINVVGPQSDGKDEVSRLHTVCTKRPRPTIGTYKHPIGLSRKRYYNRKFIALNCWIVLLLITSSTNGYVDSMINTLQMLPQWNEAFGYPTGGNLGLLNAIQNIGALAGHLFAPYISGGIGRRYTILLGASIMIVATGIQTSAKSVSIFISARLLVGFGLSFSTNAVPALVMEFVHPAHRASMTMYHSLWYTGAIVSAWTTFGSFGFKSTWAWRIPLALQALPSILQVFFVFSLPESPRWLISNGKYEQAKKTLAYCYADGNENDTSVKDEFEEITAAVRADTPNVGWTSLLSTPGHRKRLRLIIALAVFSQWSGNGLISYYLSNMFDLINIINPTTQLLINGSLQIWKLFCALWASTLTERLGRRFLFILSACGMLLSLALQTFFSSLFAHNESPIIAHAIIVFIFLFSAFYHIAFTPLIITYTIEILPNHFRAKTFNIFNVTVQIAAIINTYVNPIALDYFGWKCYIIYICWLAFEVVFLYFFIIETRNKTFEQTAALFDEVPLTKKHQYVLYRHISS